MARTFLSLDTNKHLGSLKHLIREKADVILTNPPYVTQGSAIYKQEIKKDSELQEFYDRSGLGLESLFVRYIIDALKPGGKAFVIVPQGFLARTETTAKGYILEKCIIRGVIAIPRNTFYATPQKTYILSLEKRKINDTETQTSPVFCYLVGEIGETRDAERIPCRNDLDELANEFLLFKGNPTIYTSSKSRVKIIPAASFGAGDRWDTHRFWTEKELVKLGDEETPISKEDFLSETIDNLKSYIESAQEVLCLIEELEAGQMVEMSLSNPKYITISRGVRVTREMARTNPGLIPVFSGSKDVDRPLGLVSEEWARQNGIPVQDYPTLTVNANGLVGEVFYQTGKCIIHDDVNIVRIHGKFTELITEVRGEEDSQRIQEIETLLKKLLAALSEKDKTFIQDLLKIYFENEDFADFINTLGEKLKEEFDVVIKVLMNWRFSMFMEKYHLLEPIIIPEYFRWALKEAINQERFEYEAKLYSGRLSQLKVQIPITENGEFDIIRQKKLAKAQEELETLRKNIRDLGIWADQVKLEQTHH